MLAKVHAPAQLGIASRLVEVECDIGNGLPALTVVGLPDKAIDEARDRIKGAIKNSQLVLPPKRITLNLAPADLPKDGSAFDLPMAVALLAASEQVQVPVSSLFAGELALDGSLRPIRGALSYAQLAANEGLNDLYLPAANAAEAGLLKGVTIYPVESLHQLYRHLVGEALILPFVPEEILPTSLPPAVDMANIYGQEQAKRALEITAAGGHNLLLSGPPGAGKTMLAKALMGVLPPPSLEEMIEITQVHSLAGHHQGGIITSRPLRSPHHTSSNIALIGGGHSPKPGEISLSHRGVLFLDELPEFPRNVLEVLRQPLEDGRVTIARATESLTFPAKFMLVATQNPCPCGYAGDSTRECLCTAQQISRYGRKVSGPLLDRIDMIVQVPRVKDASLARAETGEASVLVAERVGRARAIQAERFGDSSATNAGMSSQDIKRFALLSPEAEELAHSALSRLSLSARTYMRIIKVARTIADLAASPVIESPHLAEALQYRANA